MTLHHNAAFAKTYIDPTTLMTMYWLRRQCLSVDYAFRAVITAAQQSLTKQQHCMEASLKSHDRLSDCLISSPGVFVLCLAYLCLKRTCNFIMFCCARIQLHCCQEIDVQFVLCGRPSMRPSARSTSWARRQPGKANTSNNTNNKYILRLSWLHDIQCECAPLPLCAP